VETDKNGSDLELRHGGGATREGNNILKENNEWNNSGNRAEGVTKDKTNTIVFYTVSNKTTGKNTSLVLGPKPGPSAPMIRYGAEVCGGKSIGFGRAVLICIDYL